MLKKELCLLGFGTNLHFSSVFNLSSAAMVIRELKKGRNFDVELRSLPNQSDSDIEIERQNRTILKC